MTIRVVKKVGGRSYAMYVESKPDARAGGDPLGGLAYQAFVARSDALAPVLFKTTRWYDTEAEAIAVMQAEIDALAPLRTGGDAVAAPADKAAQRAAVRDRILALAPTCHKSEIVRRVGMTQEYVSSVLAAAGVQAARQPAGRLRILGAKQRSDPKKGGRRFNHARIEQIRTLAESGLSKVEIARELGVTRSAIVQLAARHLPDVEFRDARQTADVDRIKALAERGYTKSEVARELGVSRAAISLCAARRLPHVVFREGSGAGVNGRSTQRL